MEIKVIDNSRFGLKIADNMSLQALRYIWAKKASAQIVTQSFLKINNAADDSFVLTIDKIYNAAPEFILRKSQYPPENLQVKFYNLIEVAVKNKKGRPRKNAPRSIIQKSPVNPIQVADEIQKAIIAYKEKYKIK